MAWRLTKRTYAEAPTWVDRILLAASSNGIEGHPDANRRRHLRKSICPQVERAEARKHAHPVRFALRGTSERIRLSPVSGAQPDFQQPFAEVYMTTIRSLCLIVSTSAALLGGCGGGESDTTPAPMRDPQVAVADPVGVFTPEPLSRTVAPEPVGPQDPAGSAPEGMTPEPLLRVTDACEDGQCPK